MYSVFTHFFALSSRRQTLIFITYGFQRRRTELQAQADTCWCKGEEMSAVIMWGADKGATPCFTVWASYPQHLLCPH